MVNYRLGMALISDESNGRSSTLGPARLYVIPGSHACRSAMLMLDHKDVPFNAVTLPTGWHWLGVRVRGFPGRTVPALVHEGRRAQTNPVIARFLDELCPEPPLFPADPARRREVEQVEEWGHTVFQMAVRRLTLAASLRGLDALVDRGDTGRLGTLLWHSRGRRQRGMRLAGRYAFGVNEDVERDLLAGLPAMLDRIDGLLEAGVLGGASPNAADFTVAPCLALLACRRDLRPQVESRPAWALVERLLPAPPPVAAPARG
jgi:glutathione S-transferase